MADGRDGGEDREERGVYIISVAAELAGMHPQTLRIYERKGLVRPARTAGNTRRYSERDIETLRAIHQLTQEAGVNLAGVKMIVEMERQLEELRRTVEELSGEMQRARQRARALAEQARLQAEEQARRREAEERLRRDANAIVPRSTYAPRPWEGV
ncbi:MAG TPA: helix-turn-helix transcriptional regulator [Actinomycetota bacterium]|jgi:MerR family transcriptional regulator/heat shock protein HspR